MHTDLSTGWSFERGRAGRGWLGCADAPSGITVDLPHTWNERDTFQEDVAYYRGWGSYRRALALPSLTDPSSCWHLCSGGFYGTGDVWLNGTKLADFDGQYLGFRVDATSRLAHGRTNHLGIRLNNKYSRSVLPGIRMPDFLLHGGLSARVWLERLSAAHISRQDFWTNGRLDGLHGGIADCRFAVANTAPLPVRLTARGTLFDAAGQTLGAATSTLTVPAMANLADQEIRITAPSVQPWSPDSPALYTFTLELLGEAGPVDAMDGRIGFRDAEFRPGAGFFLNGNRIQLRGCNRHGSMPGFGHALPDSLNAEDAAAIRRLGLNFVRLSHYPQSPAFLDACDEQGLLVYAEIATWKSVRGYGRWLRAACRQMRDMILRDRSHPSVILWGMGNEERSRRAFANLQAIARDLDPGRPTIYAENHLHRAVRHRTTGMPDVWGSNYELGLLAEGAAASRLKVALVSEMSNYPPGRRGELARELEQVALIESDLERLDDHPQLAGFALWCWNDYATIRKARYFRHCGITDAWRVPKLAAWLLGAMYSHRPLVHLAGDWSPGGGSAEREIHVFTNCPDVTISIDSKPLEVLRGGVHRIMRVQYRHSPLVASGAGPLGTAQAVLPAHDAAVRLAVVPERLQASAAGRDTVPFLLHAVDAVGHDASDWNGSAAVSVDGPARLRAYTPGEVVPISGGIGRGFITSSGTAGAVTITASHPDLGNDLATVVFGP